jgi:hypothetical protein
MPELPGCLTAKNPRWTRIRFAKLQFRTHIEGLEFAETFP